MGLLSDAKPRASGCRTFACQGQALGELVASADRFADLVLALDFLRLQDRDLGCDLAFMNFEETQLGLDLDRRSGNCSMAPIRITKGTAMSGT